MKFRPSRGAFARPVLGRLTVAMTLGCGLLAIAAPIASAHNVVPVVNGCTSVTFNYSDFPTTGNDAATETLTINGVTGPTKTVTWSNSTTFTDTVPFNGAGLNGDSLTDNVTLSSTADGFMGTETHTFTLSGCKPALIYTGRAYDLGVTASLLGGLIKVGPLTLIDSNPIKTTATTTEGGNLLTANLGSLLLSVTGSQTVATGVGGDGSAANATIEAANSGTLGIKATAIAASSATSCNESTHALTETGGTTIASLTIGGTNVTIPNPIPANYVVLGIPGVTSLVLNEQLPTADGDGLQVNAIDLKLGPLMNLASAQVIIGHAESDVEGC
jgi:hypothetical protein